MEEGGGGGGEEVEELLLANKSDSLWQSLNNSA